MRTPVSPWQTELSLFRYNSSANLWASIRSLLFPSLSRAFFRGLHTTSLATCGFSKSYSHAAQVPSSKVTDKVPRSPAKNSRMVAALVSRMDSMTCLWNPSPRPRWLLDARRAQYTFHCSLRVLLFVGDDACAHNLLLRGRPFIMRLQQLSLQAP